MNLNGICTKHEAGMKFYKLHSYSTPCRKYVDYIELALTLLHFKYEYETILFVMMINEHTHV